MAANWSLAELGQPQDEATTVRKLLQGVQFLPLVTIISALLSSEAIMNNFEKAVAHLMNLLVNLQMIIITHGHKDAHRIAGLVTDRG